MADETITLGRSKRSTAGNRMRELLEKAHQQDEEEMFKEEEDDEEFAEPTEVRDVYLDEFADTDDEAEVDEEAEEREVRREEKRKSKGKGKAVYNPLVGQPKPKKASGVTSGTSTSSSARAEALTLLDPSIDPSTMAPSTLVLALRKQRREAKRQQRSEVRRSNLRASTLKTEAEIAEREKQQREAASGQRKGRKALHEGGEARGVRNLSQAELIAEALEEEERNKEELQKWLRREEERRELTRVGRKRVRGPRWTWISRTVGKMVEVIEDGDKVEMKTVEASQAQTAQPDSAIPQDTQGSGTAEPSSKEPADADGRASVTTPPLEPIASQTDQGEVKPVEQDPTAPRADANEATETTPATASDGKTHEASAVVDDSPVNPPGPKSDESHGVSATTSQVNPMPHRPLEARPGPDDAGPSTPTMPSVQAVQADSALSTEQTKGQQTAPPLAKVSTPTADESSAKPRPSAPPVLASASTPNQPAEPSQYTRNYLILSQVPGGLPAELSLILGSHVEWDQVKYIPARIRPINRRRPICPFTGKIAKYRHPGTMIPYADVSGYREIEAMLKNRYVWSEGGFWVGGEEDMAVGDAEEIEGWREAVHGGWMGGFAIPVPEEQAEDVVMEEEAAEEMEEIEVAKPVKKGKKQKRASEVEVEEVTPAKSKSKKRRR